MRQKVKATPSLSRDAESFARVLQMSMSPDNRKRFENSRQHLMAKKAAFDYLLNKHPRNKSVSDVYTRSLMQSDLKKVNRKLRGHPLKVLTVQALRLAGNALKLLVNIPAAIFQGVGQVVQDQFARQNTQQQPRASTQGNNLFHTQGTIIQQPNMRNRKANKHGMKVVHNGAKDQNNGVKQEPLLRLNGTGGHRKRVAASQKNNLSHS